MTWEIDFQDNERIFLEDRKDHSFRLVVTPSTNEDTDDHVQRVYPCRTCEWANACGGDCHS